jgi:hypothetical protein
MKKIFFALIATATFALACGGMKCGKETCGGQCGGQCSQHMEEKSNGENGMTCYHKKYISEEEYKNHTCGAQVKDENGNTTGYTCGNKR